MLRFSFNNKNNSVLNKFLTSAPSFNFFLVAALTQTRFYHNSYQTAFEKQQLYKQQKYKEIIEQIRKISNQVKAQNQRNNAKNQQQTRGVGNNNNNSSAKATKWEQKGRKQDEDNSSSRDDHRRLFDIRHKFSNEIIRLLPHHFEQMTLKEITFLLATTSTLTPVNGASHIASNIAAVLPSKLEETDIYECTDTVIQLLQIIRSSIYNTPNGSATRLHNNQQIRAHTQPGMTFQQQKQRMQMAPGNSVGLIDDDNIVDILEYTMRRLMDHFVNTAAEAATTTTSTKAQNSSQSTSNDTKEQQQEEQQRKSEKKKMNEISRIDDAVFRQKVILRFLSRSNDKNMQHLFPEDTLQEFVCVLLSDAASFGLSKNTTTHPSSSAGTAKKRQQQPLSFVIAVVATSICKLRLLNPVVVDFFKWAATICIDEVDVLSGHQLGYILEAFSLVGYHHPGLFITLGGKAGELGELLREDEVARILNAIGRTKIEHSKLRASLESSMRMKSMHRSSMTTVNMF